MGNSTSKNNSLIIGVSVAILGGFLIYKLIIRSNNNKQNNRCLTTLLNPQIKYPLELILKEYPTHDTRRLRFALPSQAHSLGIQLGHHIMLTARINGELVVRPYTPTSAVDAQGHFDLVLKVYKANENKDFPNGGKMTQFLDAMKIGERIDVRGPTGRIVYKRNGIFELKFERTSPLTTKKVTHIGMIAGGTGITPMFQLIKDICNHPEDKTKMSLIFCNKTERDILLRDELDAFANENPGQLDIWYTVSNSSEPDWKYGKCRVCDTMLNENLPPPGEGVLILICGPSSMVKSACLPNLEKLGYTKDMIFVC